MKKVFGFGPVVIGLVASLSAVLSPSDVVGTTRAVGSVDVPTVAVFRVESFGVGRSGAVVGAVHAVNRVEGGTVLYWSAALQVDPTTTNSSCLFGIHGGPVDGLALVVPQASAVYAPLVLANGEYAASDPKEVAWSTSGRMLVGYAVFPELPPDVSEVYVRIGYLHQMADRPVPVGDGPLEPTVDKVPVELGAGWPVIPQASLLKGADPAAHTFPLYYQTGTDDDAVATVESSTEVLTTFAADVLFAKDSADLSDEAASALAMVGSDLKDRGTGVVVVTGHTDSDGTDAYNMDLSRRRAQAVVDALVPLSGKNVTFEVVAKGETEPIAPNSTPEGQQKNRRVTVEYEVAK